MQKCLTPKVASAASFPGERHGARTFSVSLPAATLPEGWESLNRASLLQNDNLPQGPCSYRGAKRLPSLLQSPLVSASSLKAQGAQYLLSNSLCSPVKFTLLFIRHFVVYLISIALLGKDCLYFIGEETEALESQGHLCSRG